MIQSLLYLSALPNRGKIEQNEGLTPILPLFFPFLFSLIFTPRQFASWPLCILKDKYCTLSHLRLVPHGSWNWAVCLYFFLDPGEQHCAIVLVLSWSSYLENVSLDVAYWACRAALQCSLGPDEEMDTWMKSLLLSQMQKSRHIVMA